MFSLGEKQLVLNKDADVTVIDPVAGTVRATSAAILITDSIAIKGFGTFPIASITDFKARRAQTPVLESKDWTVVAPASIAVGEAVEVRITYKTSRYAGEDAINYIGGSRPIVFETAALTGVTTANIRTAIVAGWAAFLATFPNASPKISVAAGAAAADLLITASTGNADVTITKVELKRVVQGAGSQTPVSLAVNVVNAVGTEGHGQGKFLEESIRMATPEVTNPYGIGGSDWNPDVRAEYTEISFKVSATYDVSIIPHGSDLTAAAVHSYMVYLNESTSLAANGAINDLAAVGVLVAAALSNVSATAISAPLTRAQEEVEALIIEDGSSVATAANFIA